MTLLSPLSTQPVVYQQGFEVGAQVFVFDAGTTTPRTAYQDAAAATPYPSPIRTDANGCIPPFWVSGDAYKVRILSASGSLIREIDNIAGEPETAATGGSSGTATVGLQTGDVLWRPTSGVLDGKVRLNGRTIGNALSGGTERAAEDARALFVFLWVSLPTLAVSGGRGGSAVDDFNAAKTIVLPDLRGRTLFGADDMGASSATRLVGVAFDGGGTNIAVGSTGGEAAHALIINELPVHSHTASSVSAGGHTHPGSSVAAGGGHTHAVTDPQHEHTVNYAQVTGAGTGYNAPVDQGYTPGSGVSSGTVRTSKVSTGITLAAVADHTHTLTIVSDGAHTHIVNVNDTGGGASHNNMPPFMIGTFYIVL